MRELAVAWLMGETTRRGAADVWDVSEARAGQSLEIAAAGVTLAVDDVYRDGLEDFDDAPR